MKGVLEFPAKLTPWIPIIYSIFDAILTAYLASPLRSRSLMMRRLQRGAEA